MHELTIAKALVDQVCDHAAFAKAAGVTDVSIRLGVLRGIARSLYFCFPAAAQNTCCEQATLHIEETALTVFCSRCDEVKKPASLYNFRCPDCGWPTPRVLTGRELDLVSLRFLPTAGTASECDLKQVVAV